MFARMSTPHFWHEVAIALGGPLAMAGFSLGLAHILEQEEGPALPPLHGPNSTQRTRSSSSQDSLPKAVYKDTSSSLARQGEQVNRDDKNGDENDSSEAMRLIFAFS